MEKIPDYQQSLPSIAMAFFIVTYRFISFSLFLLFFGFLGISIQRLNEEPDEKFYGLAVWTSVLGILVSSYACYYSFKKKITSTNIFMPITIVYMLLIVIGCALSISKNNAIAFVYIFIFTITLFVIILKCLFCLCPIKKPDIPEESQEVLLEKIPVDPDFADISEEKFLNDEIPNLVNTKNE